MWKCVSLCLWIFIVQYKFWKEREKKKLLKMKDTRPNTRAIQAPAKKRNWTNGYLSLNITEFSKSCQKAHEMHDCYFPHNFLCVALYLAITLVIIFKHTENINILTLSNTILLLMAGMHSNPITLFSTY